MFDDPHRALSKGFMNLTNRIDRFFGEERVHQESRGSHIWISLDAVSQEGEPFGYASGTRAKVVLPRTEERLKLLLESEDGRRTSDLRDERLQEDVVSSVETNQYTAAGRVTVTRSTHWNIDTDLGLRVHSGFDPFVRLRVRRAFFPQSEWQLRATETVAWFRKTELTETTQLDLEHQVDTDKFFRASLNATWREETRWFDFGQNLFLYYNISPSRGLVYQGSVFGRSEPNAHVTQYLLAVRYRKRVYRDWLYVEARPEARFPEEENFKFTPAFVLRLDMLFGDRRR